MLLRTRTVQTRPRLDALRRAPSAHIVCSSGSSYAVWNGSAQVRNRDGSCGILSPIWLDGNPFNDASARICHQPRQAMRNRDIAGREDDDEPQHADVHGGRDASSADTDTNTSANRCDSQRGNWVIRPTPYRSRTAES